MSATPAPPLAPLPLAALAPARLQAFVFRAPIATPVRTSFGVMHDRPALLVRVEDSDGAAGWGEVWCNFPACGAEHRARLITSVFAPALTSRGFAGPAEAFSWLSERTAVLAIQSGEPGPMAQCIAGIDLALWDLCARRADQPLWRYLGGQHDEIGVYASGINPDAPHALAAACEAQGYRGFKLKIGFGAERDLANLAQMRRTLAPSAQLMVDANQGYSLDEACAMSARLAEFDLAWLEEPLRADRPWSEWQALRDKTTLPLAGGENVAGEAAFAQAIGARVFSVLQPDSAKWGGISGCWPVIAQARQAGLRYCPHYLGGGVGLLHSAHLLAAAGGDGLLEIDANTNPLRSLLATRLSNVREGRCSLGAQSGIGQEPDLQQLAGFAAVQ